MPEAEAMPEYGDTVGHRREERYRAFIENSSDGLWCFELEQPVALEASESDQIAHLYQYAFLSECNEAMAHFYGFERAASLIGARLGDLLNRDNPDHLALLQAFIQSDYRLRNVMGQEADEAGNIKYFSSDLIGITKDGALRSAWGTKRDITDQKAVQATLQQQTQELALLYEAGYLLGATLEPERIYDTLREMIARIMDCDGLMVSLYTETEQLIRCAYAWVEGNKIDVTAFPPLPLAPLGEGMQSSVIRTGQPILINDYVAHTQKSVVSYYANNDGTVNAVPDPNKAVVNAMMLVPIKLDAQVLGVAQRQSFRRDAYTTDHLRILESLLIQMAAASRNAYLFREVQAAAQQQRQFLRDALASMTAGKLCLCFSAHDLPPPLPLTHGPNALSSTAGFHELREQIRETAEADGFPEERWRDFLIAASETAMNAVVHAGSGEARIGSNGHGTIQVWITDVGKGISVDRLPRATLEIGYTTAGTLGYGMKMMLATTDRVWLLTGPQGTTVVLEQDRIAPPDDPF